MISLHTWQVCIITCLVTLPAGKSMRSKVKDFSEKVYQILSKIRNLNRHQKNTSNFLRAAFIRMKFCLILLLIVVAQLASSFKPQSTYHSLIHFVSRKWIRVALHNIELYIYDIIIIIECYANLIFPFFSFFLIYYYQSISHKYNIF